MQLLDHYIIVARKRKFFHILGNSTRHRKTCGFKVDKTQVVKSFHVLLQEKATQDPKHLRPPNTLLRNCKLPFG
ncbi:hypothetical protein NQ317_003563 [Molorchus minor]|uniref:Uncharacterized protein n=1 Tax=Molorchus minor TaxID=1323400 RepID=A0ABQ9IPZ5_9CUCU|nr:hypothetical protein NQ317_003563 [Molorchus minor]